ncbi:major facilitator superfamily domain-containing protein [Cyathus striatus]|nr:major facilitator superfamily domain-containing protein [Cyathus striatus]
MSAFSAAVTPPLEGATTRSDESISYDGGVHNVSTEVSAGRPSSASHPIDRKIEYAQDSIPTYLAERSPHRSTLSERPRQPSAFSHGHTHIYPPISLHHDSLDNHSEVPVFNYEASTQVAVIEAPSSVDGAANLQQERKWKRNATIQLCALCFTFYLEGWNDASTGPLLPVVQRDYHIGFAVVALLFVSNCVGFVSAAFINVWMDQRFGFGKSIVLGAICQLAAYAILAPAPRFPIMVFAYGINGFGMAFQNAQANGFVASVKDNMTMKLGMLHASYGLGAFTSPFLATHFSTQKHWSFHYLCSAGISVINVAVLSYVFRLKRQEDILAEAGQFPSQEPNQHIAGGAQTQGSLYRQILTIKAVHFLALFALIYVGVEVTLGGWIVTFIIQERDGGPSAGFISSGFFGGLTLGRIGLMWLNKLVGERRVIFVYTLLCIVFEITIWLVPSIVQNALAISFIGILLGPMFPILISHSTKILPGGLLTGSVGLISSIGVSGSALLPFITGVLASKFGIGSLQPLMVSMMSLMIVLWALVPKAVRRLD